MDKFIFQKGDVVFEKDFGVGKVLGRFLEHEHRNDILVEFNKENGHLNSGSGRGQPYKCCWFTAEGSFLDRHIVLLLRKVQQ